MYYLLASLISSMAIHILLTKKIKMRIKMVSSVAHVHPEIYTIQIQLLQTCLFV